MKDLTKKNQLNFCFVVLLSYKTNSSYLFIITILNILLTQLELQPQLELKILFIDSIPIHTFVPR